MSSQKPPPPIPPKPVTPKGSTQVNRLRPTSLNLQTDLNKLPLDCQPSPTEKQEKQRTKKRLKSVSFFEEPPLVVSSDEECVDQLEIAEDAPMHIEGITTNKTSDVEITRKNGEQKSYKPEKRRPPLPQTPIKRIHNGRINVSIDLIPKHFDVNDLLTEILKEEETNDEVTGVGRYVKEKGELLNLPNIPTTLEEHHKPRQHQNQIPCRNLHTERIHSSSMTYRYPKVPEEISKLSTLPDHSSICSDAKIKKIPPPQIIVKPLIQSPLPTTQPQEEKCCLSGSVNLSCRTNSLGKRRPPPPPKSIKKLVSNGVVPNNSDLNDHLQEISKEDDTNREVVGGRRNIKEEGERLNLPNLCIQLEQRDKPKQDQNIKEFDQIPLSNFDPGSINSSSVSYRYRKAPEEISKLSIEPLSILAEPSPMFSGNAKITKKILTPQINVKPLIPTHLPLIQPQEEKFGAATKTPPLTPSQSLQKPYIKHPLPLTPTQLSVEKDLNSIVLPDIVSNNSPITSEFEHFSPLLSFVIMDLLASEEQYVEQLQVGVQMLNKFRKDGLSEKTLAKFFGSLEEIWLVHIDFLEELEMYTKAPERIGYCFMKHLPKFDVYIERQWAVSNEFDDFEKLMLDSKNLQIYFNLTKARVAEYSKKLQYFNCKCEKENLKETIDEAIRKIENLYYQLEMVEQFKKIDGFDKFKKCGKVYLNQPFKVSLNGNKRKNFLVYFCEHLIIFTSIQDNGNYQYVDDVPTVKCYCNIMNRRPNKVFEIGLSGKKRFTLKAESQAVKELWCGEIQKVLRREQLEDF